MGKLAREPLVHFLLLGAALFVAFGLWGRPTRGAPGAIVIKRDDVASLAAEFTRTRLRRPSSEELEGLIQERIRDEVYCREAVTLGLDKDDAIIRRRLRQKMEFVSEDAGTQAEPTEDELRAYLREHAAEFRIEPRFTFRHVYLDPLKHSDRLRDDARRLLDRLSAGGHRVDLASMGDPFLPAHDYDAVPKNVIAKQFGEAFAARLGDLPLGRWQGPIDSTYGTHLVYVSARIDGRDPPFAEVRDAVRRSLEDARRLEANETYYRGLLKRYVVTVERPAAVVEQR